MILRIYLVILAYFFLGAIGFYFINRKKEQKTARKNRRKIFTYFIIVNVLFFSIVWHSLAFRIVSILILLTGAGEMFKLFVRSGYHNKVFFVLSLLVFLLLGSGFYYFSTLQQGWVLFTFLITAVFDSFSQITGQLAGKKRILPEISPGKTWEGTAGGAAVAMASGLLLNSLIGIQNWQTMLVTVGIILFAFVGDAITSLYKRTYHVKDFTNILPGHGGFLDRFDSFIPAGAFIALLYAFSYI